MRSASDVGKASFGLDYVFEVKRSWNRNTIHPVSRVVEYSTRRDAQGEGVRKRKPVG